MSVRPILRAGALVTAGALVALVGSPAVAATPVAQASGSGISITVAGNTAYSGEYASRHDGEKETTSGDNTPPIGVLGGQRLISAGTIAQDARTRVDGRNGISDACAGLAGDGASLAGVGDGNCLSGGDNVAVNAGNLDLSDLTLTNSDVLDGLGQPLQDALTPVIGQVLPPLQTGLQTALTSLGDLNVVVDLGAVQSRCHSTPSQATGDSDLADASAYVDVMGQRLTLLALPVHPAPNTKVVTDLDKVVQAVLDALRTELSTALAGSLSQLNLVLDQAAVINNVVAQLGDQLAPLEENVLDGTLNKQVRPSANSIQVTALDLKVLPVAGMDGLLHITIGTSTCGPNDRVAPPTTSPSPTPTPTPAVPTSVPAGYATAPTATEVDQPMSLAAKTGMGALLLLAAAAGLVSYRRSTGRS